MHTFQLAFHLAFYCEMHAVQHEMPENERPLPSLVIRWLNELNQEV